MKAQSPHILQSQRGWRTYALRRSPRNWIAPPLVEEKKAPSIAVPSIIQVDITLTALPASDNLATFTVAIHGKRFHRPKSETKTDQTQLPLFPETSSLRASPQEQTESPYSHLYEILYPPPIDFAADNIAQFSKLHSYQTAGVDFLVRREHALLADDPGLGKTAQCLIAIAVLQKSERVARTLVICPRSVVLQWKREAKRWAGLHVTIVDGEKQKRAMMWKHSSGLLIVTPQIVLNDAEIVAQLHFDLVVCDDISMLKNPNSKMTNAIREIPRQRSWCLNGTPLENKPEDFVNTMQFVYPDLFSRHERNKTISPKVLKARVEPYFLRRRTKDYLTELKEKESIGPLEIEMSPKQARKYRKYEQQQWEEYQMSEANPNKLHIFALITRLIQVCNVDTETGESSKADAIEVLLEQILADVQSDSKAIVFSRFTKTFGLEYLKEKYAAYNPILYHGEMNAKQREEAVEQFRDKGRLMLISTAGARGINLQMANYVFHFDRGWNPAYELQAEARCWRMGQEKTVFVYRYMQVGTIEERIHQVLEQKRAMFDEYVDSMVEVTDDFASTKFSMEDLVNILRPSTPKHASRGDDL